MTKTIVFIHGLFQNPKSWDAWVDYFEMKGYTCLTPAYPYHEGEPSDLRTQIDPALGKLTLNEVVDHLVSFIDANTQEKPILVGHSMGGLIVQKLIAMEKGVAGVCIDSAPPKGISSFAFSFLKSNLPVIHPFKGDTPFMPTYKWFQYAFCNTMTMEQSIQEYNTSVVPESRNIPRSSARKDGYIDFKKPHAPLLFIAGANDHIIPVSLNKKNYDAYSDPLSKKDFKIFENRTHYICNQPNWQEVAEYVHNWLIG